MFQPEAMDLVLSAHDKATVDAVCVPASKA